MPLTHVHTPVTMSNRSNRKSVLIFASHRVAFDLTWPFVFLITLWFCPFVLICLHKSCSYLFKWLIIDDKSKCHEFNQWIHKADEQSNWMQKKMSLDVGQRRKNCTDFFRRLARAWMCWSTCCCWVLFIQCGKTGTNTKALLNWKMSARWCVSCNIYLLVLFSSLFTSFAQFHWPIRSRWR